ncbi:hypothetical protein OESDEN_16464, partial [Oesophagostomum dentatum]
LEHVLFFRWDEIREVTSLISGKTRLAPKKSKQTIPRLNTSAVLMAIRLANAVVTTATIPVWQQIKNNEFLKLKKEQQHIYGSFTSQVILTLQTRAREEKTLSQFILFPGFTYQNGFAMTLKLKKLRDITEIHATDSAEYAINVVVQNEPSVPHQVEQTPVIPLA